jgi:hypothetical protein
VGKDERKSKRTIIESNPSFQPLLLLPRLNRLDVPNRIHNRDSLDSINLLKIHDAVLVPVRALERTDKVRSVAVRGEERTGDGGGGRIDVDEKGVRGRFNDRVGVLTQSMTVRELSARPSLRILRNVEDHFAPRSGRVTGLTGGGLEGGDEVLAYSSDTDDAPRFPPDGEIDKRLVLVEEVNRGVQPALLQAPGGRSVGGRAAAGLGRVERGAVDEFGGDERGEVFFVVGEDAAGSVREKVFRSGGEGVLSVVGLRIWDHNPRSASSPLDERERWEMTSGNNRRTWS